MPRGYRSFVLAAVGWLILAADKPHDAPIPRQTTRSNQTETSTTQGGKSDPKVSAPVREAIQSNDYQKSCGQARNDHDSDLCAQWTAADAAKEAALYTARAFWAAVVGSIVALIALLITIRGTRAAIDAVEAQIAAERPLLTIADLKVTKQEDKEGLGRFFVRLDWGLNNEGKTGCWIERFCIYPDVLKDDESLPLIWGTRYERKVVAHIAPRKGLSNANTDKTQWAIFPQDVDWLTKNKVLHVFGYAVYQDPGGRRWRTGFAFEIDLDDNFNSVRYGPAPSPEVWRDEQLRGLKRRWYQRLADKVANQALYQA